MTSLAELMERGRDRFLSPEKPGTLGSMARARRWEEFGRRFPDFSDMRLVDLGGYPKNWESAPTRPKHITCINIDDTGQDGSDDADMIIADACSLPEELFDGRFDIVYSNSVIEHVGGPARRKAFAESCLRLAPHCWIQTPARSFPVEPHWMFPGFQFLPVRAAAWISPRWPLAMGIPEGLSYEESVELCLSVDLVSAPEMNVLFPDTEIFHERILGLTKSFVAVR